MTFYLEEWLSSYTDAVKRTFGNRIWFLGLQGSYGRGEATNTSDIDVVLVLETAAYEDFTAYSRLLDTLPHREKVCGFLSGRAELEAWEKSDLFQFCYDTTPICGSLTELMQTIDEQDVKRAIQTGACNIYHACVHNTVHEKSGDVLKALYKSAVFTLQAIAYLQNGVFERRQAGLFPLLSEEDQRILERRLRLKCCGTVSADEFEELSRILIEWASRWIQKK